VSAPPRTLLRRRDLPQPLADGATASKGLRQEEEGVCNGVRLWPIVFPPRW
jgi:hypothetical protein